MMNEIGGYFGLDIFKGEEYYPNLIAVNTARHALAYIIRARKIKKLYLPYFLCDSVYKLCQKENCEYEFYNINENFLPIFDKELQKDEYLYVVNYYGQLTKKQIKFYKNKYKNIIVDNVQAFFSKPIKDIDTVYSCRKYFGVPDGGYVYSTVKISDELETDKSKNRMGHVLGRFEDSASEHYAEFKESDESFNESKLYYMSNLTKNILRALDYKQIIKRRNDNFNQLQKAFGKINKIKVKRPKGPYCYPLYIDNGMQIKKRLAKEGVFIATLWPNVIEDGGELEKKYAENILPLPIDQRYAKQDMKRIVKIILDVLYSKEKTNV